MRSTQSRFWHIRNNYMSYHCISYHGSETQENFFIALESQPPFVPTAKHKVYLWRWHFCLIDHKFLKSSDPVYRLNIKKIKEKARELRYFILLMLPHLTRWIEQTFKECFEWVNSEVLWKWVIRLQCILSKLNSRAPIRESWNCTDHSYDAGNLVAFGCWCFRRWKWSVER